MNPKVTVLMPAYNAAKYIAEAIQSVLNQTYSNWELLIVNDGSTDNTVKIIESFKDSRIRLLNNPENLRLIKTLNLGLSAAKGEFIARLDADDRALPERLRLQVEALEEDLELALVGGRSDVIDELGQLKIGGEDKYLPSTYEDIKFASMFFNPFRHSAVTFRRELVLALGGYPIGFQDVEDFALWSMLIDQHRAINLKHVVCEYRTHPDSVMQKSKKKSSSGKSDPRLEITRSIYNTNAYRIIGDREFSEKWAEEWPKVQYAHCGRVEFATVRQHLGEVIRHRGSIVCSPNAFRSVLKYSLCKFSRLCWSRKAICNTVFARMLLLRI